jgi:entericidin A
VPLRPWPGRRIRTRTIAEKLLQNLKLRRRRAYGMDVAVSGRRGHEPDSIVNRDGERNMSLNEIIRSLGIASIAALLFGVAGCNTVEGFGEDVQSAGEEIEETAEEF